MSPGRGRDVFEVNKDPRLPPLRGQLRSPLSLHPDQSLRRSPVSLEAGPLEALGETQAGRIVEVRARLLWP